MRASASAIAFSLLLAAAGAQSIPPANPQLTREAREVLRYLQRLSGKGTIAGNHNYPQASDRTTWNERAFQLTGRRPGLWGSDLGWDKSCLDSRPGLMDEAIRQWQGGALVQLSWHTVRPMDEDGTAEDGSWQKMVQGQVTAEEWRQIVTPGTPLHAGLLKHLDAIAGSLVKLRDAKVPVLWRPYHEMNGGWFWWGAKPGKDGFAKLWQIMFDRFTQKHRLHNLIWVWSPGAPDGQWGKPFEDFYPGHRSVDILALDVYHGDFRPAYYDGLKKLAAGRPIALGEVGEMPSAATLEAQPNWVWFLVWAQHFVEANKPERIADVFKTRRLLDLSQVKARQTAASQKR